MPQVSTAALKILGKVTVSGGLVASGSGVASLTRGEVPEKEVEVIKIEKLKNTAEEEVLNRVFNKKKAKITVHRKQNFIEEKLSTDLNENKKLLYDQVLEKETENVYYILKSDKTRIRLSVSKPKKPNEGIYKGWKLYKFDWKNGGSYWYGWYGYCPPDPESEKQNCENLPDGWEKKEVSIKPVSPKIKNGQK